MLVGNSAIDSLSYLNEKTNEEDDFIQLIKKINFLNRKVHSRRD